MGKYSLWLYETKESINLDGNDKEVNHLYITSTILESYFSIMNTEAPLPHEMNNALLTFNALLGNGLITRIINETNNIHFLFPSAVGLLKQTSEMTAINLLNEIKLLHYAVVNWIDEKNMIKNGQFNPETTEGKTLLKLQQNLFNSPATPLIIGNLGRRHESDSLLTLAWAEVWYAIENKIRARCCPYCGQIFYLPPNNPRKANCLKPACKQKYEVDRHGGLEAYREWERNRKKVSSKRPPGRPKKEKEGV